MVLWSWTELGTKHFDRQVDSVRMKVSITVCPLRRFGSASMVSAPALNWPAHHTMKRSCLVRQLSNPINQPNNQGIGSSNNQREKQTSEQLANERVFPLIPHCDSVCQQHEIASSTLLRMARCDTSSRSITSPPHAPRICTHTHTHTLKSNVSHKLIQ